MKALFFAVSLLLVSSVSFASGKPTLYFISPQNGDVVQGKVTVQFGLKNFGIAPAGVVRDNTGHHHLIIDSELPDLSKPIPSDANHIHFGGGQTETTLELAPGKHTLQLLLGNAMHIPHKPVIKSEKITITVK